MKIPTGKILLWMAKIFSAILSILMIMFMFGDGFPDFSWMSPRETILFICFFGMFVGLNLLWYIPKPAAWTIAGSAFAFWLIEVIYTGGFWMHWFFFLYPLIAVIIFLSFKYPEYEIEQFKSKKKAGRKRTKRK
jgi:hypothetical protein